MTIIEKTKVVEAYLRVMRELGGNHENACASVAQTFSLPVEAVAEVVANQVQEVTS